MPMELSDRDFHRVAGFIHRHCGIKMPPSKKAMLQARLQKRMRVLGMTSFRDYAEYVFSPEGIKAEMIHMIDRVTTNKTDFFREPKHFEYLLNAALPSLLASRENGFRKKVTLWSAGCSTGEEPYTLAMVLAEYAEKNPGFDFSILATDISTVVLAAARKGIYETERIHPVPPALRRKYLLKGRGSNRGVVRIVPELRGRVTFGRLNFMDADFGIRDRFDIIFCRNVIIYFDFATQEKVLNKFYHQLSPGGYLFMGHSETLSGMNVPLISVSASVYEKPRERGGEHLARLPGTEEDTGMVRGGTAAVLRRAGAEFYSCRRSTPERQA